MNDVPPVPDATYRIVLRPIANPLPMAFVGLGGATVVLSALQLGWVPTDESANVGLLVLLVAVPLQALASVMGYLGRDPVGATGAGTLAVSWAAIGFVTMLSLPGARSQVLGLVLFYLAAMLLVTAIVAMVGRALPALVLAVTTARLTMTGGYEYFGGTGWMHAAGWVGVALAALASYAVLALELEGVQHHPVLPTLRFGAARRAVISDGIASFDPADREPGVRGQL
jgi:succinate-acetate transporter protein